MEERASHSTSSHCFPNIRNGLSVGLSVGCTTTIGVVVSVVVVVVGISVGCVIPLAESLKEINLIAHSNVNKYATERIL